MVHKITKMLVGHSFAVILFLRLRHIFSITDDFARKLLNKKPVLYLLEYHIADHCNLNCKGCFHFSNLVDDKSFPSFEQYSLDLKRLRELFANISSVRLIGGEPLLNPDLPAFIYETKKTFPKAKVHILSNGILYKNLEGDLLKAVKTCGVKINISLYKPVAGKKEKMKWHFKANKIKHSISRPIRQFAKYIDLTGDSNSKKTVRQCPASRCTFLSCGHIARCPMPFNIKYFNRRFNQSIDMEGEKINIYETNYDGFALKKKLLKPLASCRYCKKLVWFDWANTPQGDPV